MTNTFKFLGLAVIVIVVAAVSLYLGEHKVFGATYPIPDNGNASQFTAVVTNDGYWVNQTQMASAAGWIGNIIQSGANALAVFPGTVIANNVIQASAGYAQTLTTSSTVTVPQWCAGTAILVPKTNAAPLTITLPAASSTYAACGGVAGGWSMQLIDNESSFPVTLATTTGGAGIQFMIASGSPSQFLTYPPAIPASTTETFVGQYTSTTGLNAYLDPYYRAYGTGT